MNIVDCVTDGSFLRLSAKGRIDSGNALEFENGFMEQLGKHPGLDVVFDASDIAYMSSAGLRIFLKIQQRLHRNLVIDNVQPELYTIFETAGFTRMMEVRRAVHDIVSDGGN